MYRYRFCGVCKNVKKYNNSSNPCTVQTIGVGVDVIIEAMKAKLYVQRYGFFFLPVSIVTDLISSDRCSEIQHGRL